ncbi:MAG: ferredoxin, partial [Tidjanibacter sp.]|nr:ferredoxin [Tidjanibacter sp.]
DCDCSAHPADPEMGDVGILVSLDPVALDQACVDLVFEYPSTEGDDASALIERINSRHGIHIIEHAEKIGLGSRTYELVKID